MVADRRLIMTHQFSQDLPEPKLQLQQQLDNWRGTQRQRNEVAGVFLAGRRRYPASEIELQCKLNIPFSLRREDLAERRTVHVHVRCIKDRRIGEVESLNAKF